MQDIKKGDRVKVTIEGRVRHFRDGMLDLNSATEGQFMGYVIPDLAGVVVEKIEPPVEVFKPGDVVRGKTTGYAYALGVARYTNLGGGNPGATFEYGMGMGADYFNSRNFERVNIE